MRAAVLPRPLLAGGRGGGPLALRSPPQRLRPRSPRLRPRRSRRRRASGLGWSRLGGCASARADCDGLGARRQQQRPRQPQRRRLGRPVGAELVRRDTRSAAGCGSAAAVGCCGCGAARLAAQARAVVRASQLRFRRPQLPARAAGSASGSGSAEGSMHLERLGSAGLGFGAAKARLALGRRARSAPRRGRGPARAARDLGRLLERLLDRPSAGRSARLLGGCLGARPQATCGVSSAAVPWLLWILRVAVRVTSCAGTGSSRESYGRVETVWQFRQRSSAVSTRRFGFSVSCGKFWNRGLSLALSPSGLVTRKPSAGRRGRRDLRGRRVAHVARVLVALLADGVLLVPVDLAPCGIGDVAEVVAAETAGRHGARVEARGLVDRPVVPARRCRGIGHGVVDGLGACWSGARRGTPAPVRTVLRDRDGDLIRPPGLLLQQVVGRDRGEASCRPRYACGRR